MKRKELFLLPHVRTLHRNAKSLKSPGFAEVKMNLTAVSINPFNLDDMTIM